jgi:tRNA-modifying protein YgfZ
MSMPVGVDLSAGTNALGVIAFRGADAASFLQGQLSADLVKLAPGSSTFAGLHNPQGRAIALLAIARTSAEEFLAVVPRQLLEPVIQRLRKYVFRAKVRIEDASPTFRVLGVSADTASDGVVIRWGSRSLHLVPGSEPGADVDRDGWELADIRDGIPQIYPATSEAFVAQMLNLDLLGGIAFDKGCYTGQEVIARAHYRGRVKRRLQRWRTAGSAPTPGDSARATDGRSLTIVRVAPDGAGGHELLAIGNFGAIEPGVPAEAPASGLTVEGPLSLPYSLPE